MSRPVSNKLLGEIEDLLAKVTPGPWEAPFGSYVIPSPMARPKYFYKIAQLKGSTDSPGMIARTDPYVEYDAEMIAKARTWLPALIHEIHRLRAKFTVCRCAFDCGEILPAERIIREEAEL
jgi:hypothetical protein